MGNTNWTREWPNKPGKYWFYGYLYGNKDFKKELCYVEVRKIAQGKLMFQTHGTVIYESEKHDGYFSEIDLPQLPTLFWKQNNSIWMANLQENPVFEFRIFFWQVKNYFEVLLYKGTEIISNETISNEINFEQGKIFQTDGTLQNGKEKLIEAKSYCEQFSTLGDIYGKKKEN